MTQNVLTLTCERENLPLKGIHKGDHSPARGKGAPKDVSRSSVHPLKWGWGLIQS